MDLVGPNGFFVFLFIFHSFIGFFGIYRMKVRKTVENPDSQFVAMPQTITPAGIELNPTTEHIEEPYSEKVITFSEYGSSMCSVVGLSSIPAGVMVCGIATN